MLHLWKKIHKKVCEKLHKMITIIEKMETVPIIQVNTEVQHIVFVV